MVSDTQTKKGITCTCEGCGQQQSLIFYKKDLKRMKKEPIKQVLPNLDNKYVVLMNQGICPECQDKIKIINLLLLLGKAGS